MFPIEMEEPEDMAVAPSAWQALETAWQGMSALTALAYTRRDAGQPGACRISAMPVRRITGVANHTGVSQARTVQERGGRIVLMGDLGVGTTRVAGTLDASAPDGGQGGFIETSAAVVKVDDGARVTTRGLGGEGGQNGTWLIDPTDFTVAASGGDITGTALGNALVNNNVVLDSVSGAQQGSGHLFVRDEVRWSGNRLTLRAQADIHLYSDLVGSGSAQLTMAYGLATANGAGSDYHLHNGTRVYLSEGPNLSLQKGSAGTNQTYQVITQGSTPTTAGHVAFKGMNDDTSGFYALGGSINQGTQVVDNNVVRNPTADEMKQAATFAGWDIGTTADGDSVWRIVEGESTPLLRDFRRRVDVQAVRTYNGQVQTEGTASGRDAGFHAAATDLRPLGQEITGGLTIDAAPITVSGTDVHRTYDGTTDATGATAVVTGGQLFGTDSLAGGSFAFADRHAGTGKTVVLDGIAINDGKGGANYALTVANNTGSSISAAPITVSGTDVHRTYDGTTDAQGATAVVTGGQLFGTDALAGGSFAFADRHAGTGKTVVLDGIAIDDGNGGANYALTVANNTGSSISAAPITVSGTDVHRTYDGTIDAQGATAVVTGGQLFGADSLAGGSFAFADRHAGTGKTVVVSGVTIDDGNGGANYALIVANNTGSSIAAAPLQITADAAHKTYDGTTGAQTAWRVGGGSLFGTDAIGSVALAFDTRHTGTGKSLVLGSAVVNDGNGGANYVLTLANQAASSIAAAPLQITADPAHKTFDGNTDARTTWRISAGTLFAGDALGDVGLRYDSAAVGIGKRLHLAGVALNDGNGGANYSVTLADNAGSSIRLPSVENARLEQVAANARSTVAPDAGSGPGLGSLVLRAPSSGAAPIALVDCGLRLPADLVVDDCR